MCQKVYDKCSSITYNTRTYNTRTKNQHKTVKPRGTKHQPIVLDAPLVTLSAHFSFA